MPTLITVAATTKRVKVTQFKTTDDAKISTETIIEAGAAPRQFQINRTTTIQVEELDVDRVEPLKA